MAETTVEYAIRYCMTRDSYAFEDGLDLAQRHWGFLTTATRVDVMEACRKREHNMNGGYWPDIKKALERRYPKVTDG